VATEAAPKKKVIKTKAKKIRNPPQGAIHSRAPEAAWLREVVVSTIRGAGGFATTEEIARSLMGKRCPARGENDLDESKRAVKGRLNREKLAKARVTTALGQLKPGVVNNTQPDKRKRGAKAQGPEGPQAPHQVQREFREVKVNGTTVNVDGWALLWA
jgi:hypothetical protein